MFQNFIIVILITYTSNNGNYNTATKDMFYDTQYLNFHMGHAGIGQTLTPWGWLGTYESSGNKSGYDDATLALTGWNGQVLWLATDTSGQVITKKSSYGDETSTNYGGIYDAKYDHNNNWILVVRYSGASSSDGNRPENGLKGMKLQVLDAKTGRELHTPFSIPNGARRLGDSDSNWNNSSRNYYKRYQNYVQVGDKLLWGFFTNINKIKIGHDGGVDPIDYLGDSQNNLTDFMDFLVIEKTQQGIVNIKSVEYRNKVEPVHNEESGFNKRWSLYSSPIMTIAKTNNNTNRVNITFLAAKGNNFLDSPSDIGNIVQSNIEFTLNSSGNSAQFQSIKNQSDNTPIKSIILGNGQDENVGLIKFNKNVNKPIRTMFKENAKTDQKISDFVTHPVQNILGLNNYSIPILYAVKGNRSVFSVLNVVLDDDGNYDTIKSKYFSPGYDADNYVDKNQIYDKTNAEIWNENKLDFNLFPSSRDGIANNDVNNAFMYGPFAISPFDGTIIFSARPNFRKTENNKDAFTDKTLNFASLSIASPIVNKLKKSNFAKEEFLYATFVLLNENDSSNEIFNGRTLSIAKNLTFDLYGTYNHKNESNRNQTEPKIRLYFNANNNVNNFGQINELKTNAIGKIDIKPDGRIFGWQKPYSWMTTITSNILFNDGGSNINKPNEPLENSVIKIDEIKPYAYISSIADPKKWYPNTWYNLNKSENELTNNTIINNQKLLNRTHIDKLNDKLTNIGKDGQEPNSVYTIDILSNYFDLDDKSKEFSPFWRPTVIVNNETNGSQINEKITLNYQYKYFLGDNNMLSNIWLKPEEVGLSKIDGYDSNFWSNEANNISINYEINNVSTLLTKALGNHVKISNISGKFGDDNLSIGAIEENVSNPQIGDKYGINNNDNQQLLRVEYGLVLNENDADDNQVGTEWQKAKNAENGKFSGIYEINEFKTILKQFIEWKIKNLEWDNENSKGVYGMNNLTIRSYLRFDPTKVNNKIWDISDLIGTPEGQRAYAAYHNNQLYIYKDEKYDSDDHLIFQQNSDSFNENSGGYGFKNSIKQKMYVDNPTLPNSNKIIVAPELNKVRDYFINNIVNANVFESVNTDLIKNKVVITFKDELSAKKFKNFNQMLGVGVSLMVSIFGDLNNDWLWYFNSWNMFDLERNFMIPANISYTDDGWGKHTKDNRTITFDIDLMSEHADCTASSYRDRNIRNLFKTKQLKAMGFYLLPMTKIASELNNLTTSLDETINDNNIFFDNSNWLQNMNWGNWVDYEEFRSNNLYNITYDSSIVDTKINQSSFKMFQWNNSTTLNFNYTEEESKNPYASMFDRQFSIVQKTPNNISDLNNVAIGSEQEFRANYIPYRINEKDWYTGSEIKSHLDSIKNDNQYNSFPKEFAILTRIAYVGNGDVDGYHWDKSVQFIFGNFFDSSKGQAKVNTSATSWIDNPKKPISYVTKISNFTNEFELIESQEIAGTKLKLKKNSNIANDWEKITSSGFKIAFISHNSNINVGNKVKITQKTDFIDLEDKREELLNNGVDVTFNNNQFGYVWIYSDQTNVSDDSYPELTSQPNRYRQLKIDGINNDSQLRYLAFEKENEKIEIGILSNPMETKKVTINVEYAWIRDTQFASGQTIHTLTKESIKQFEKTIISKIISPHRDSIELRFELKDSDNGVQQELTVDSLFEKISSLRKNYTNQYLGLMRLNRSSQNDAKYFNYEIRAKFTITNGMFATFVDNYEPNKEEERVNTDNIVTDINLEKYVNFLKAKKLAVEGDANNVKKITIPDNEGSNDTFLGGKTFGEIIKGLEFFGVGIEFRAKDVQGAQWGSLESITSYNENVGKILMRFSLQNNLNVKLLLPSDEEVISNDTNVNNSKEIELDLQVTLKVQVSQTFINDFKNSNPFSGNTKILNVNQTKENDLINKVLNDNKTNNDAFNRLQLEVQYQLEGMNDWKNRLDLMDFLQEQTTDYNSNQIKIKFVVKNDPSDGFVIDGQDYVVFEKDISATSQIKLYINESNFEELATKVKISGDTSSIEWFWPDGLKLINGNEVERKKGLKLQFTTKEEATQNPPKNPNINTEPIDGWSNTQPSSVDPVKRYVAIAYVASDGYELWKDVEVHQVQFDKLVSKINVETNWLDALLFQGTNTLEVNILTNKENEIKNRINDDNLKQYVDIKYQLIANNNSSNVEWVDANGLKILIDEYVKKYSNETGGILKFGTNKVSGDTNNYASINARFTSNNKDYLNLQYKFMKKLIFFNT